MVVLVSIKRTGSLQVSCHRSHLGVNVCYLSFCFFSLAILIWRFLLELFRLYLIYLPYTALYLQSIPQEVQPSLTLSTPSPKLTSMIAAQMPPRSRTNRTTTRSTSRASTSTSSSANSNKSISRGRNKRADAHCVDCAGSGILWQSDRCRDCGGSGRNVAYMDLDCSECDGRGRIVTESKPCGCLH